MPQQSGKSMALRLFALQQCKWGGTLLRLWICKKLVGNQVIHTEEKGENAKEKEVPCLI